MKAKEQLGVLKENWLIVLLLFFVLLLLSAGSLVLPFVSVFSSSANMLESGYSKAHDTLASEARSFGGGYGNSYYPENDFAPEEENRKITRSASLSTEVERGEFRSAEERLKNIVSSSDSFLLSENVNRRGEKGYEYFVGNYRVKVESDKYDSFVSQLKTIGEVQSVNENARDITGSYTDLETELALEEERLERYNRLYEDSENVEDKITLSDKIFNQERRVEYLKDSLKSKGRKVEYSNVNFIINEEKSGWMGIVFVGISDLVKSLINSLNALLYVVFVLLPWILFLVVVWLVVKYLRKRK